MSEYAGHEEPPELLGRNITVATKLWIAAQAFFWTAFIFTFFYLQQLNSNHQWDPHGVKPSLVYGSLVFGLLVLGLVLYAVGRQGLHRLGEREWILGAGIALLLGLASAALQCTEWTQVGFNPTQGGYASIFFAWTGFYVVNLVAMMYWLWTLNAEPLRAHRAFGSSQVLQANASALELYWIFFVAIGAIEYATLYFAY